MGARLGTALVPGWSRLFIKLDCVKGGPTMTPQNRSHTDSSKAKRANNSMLCLCLAFSKVRVVNMFNLTTVTVN